MRVLRTFIKPKGSTQNDQDITWGEQLWERVWDGTALRNGPERDFPLNKGRPASVQWYISWGWVDV